MARSGRWDYTHFVVTHPKHPGASHPATVEVRAATQPVASHASLLVQNGAEVSSFALHEGASLTIGRARPADIVVDNASVSRVHARFTFRADTVVVEDMGSTNGLLFAGERLSRAVLEDGDSVELGSVRATLTGVRPASELEKLRGWSTFRTATEAEIERAQTFERPFSLLAVRVTGAPQGAFDGLASQLRRVDIATLHTPDLALVLLPETPPELALQIASVLPQRLTREASCAVASFPEDATQLESLLELLVHTARLTAPGAVQRCGSRAAEVSVGGPVILSEAMRRLYELIDRVAPTTLPVLVLGETGAGKELVSRALHERSERAQGPFVAINCASIPANLLESVLFGHEKGAFTGASERRPGVFEQAQRGTVFLDEVGELSASAQAALLRVLETKRVARVGATKDTEVDVRVVAATHRNLATMVSLGTFREDLMFRLDALTLKVPPLRERIEEIEPLAERFLAQARQQWSCRASKISAEARGRLRAHGWPGNVRQLKNVIERAAVVCRGDVIGLDDLPEALVSAPVEERAQKVAVPAAAASAPAAVGERIVEEEAGLSFEGRVQAFETRLIREALAKTGGNKSKAAEILQMPRRTLGTKLQALGLLGDDAL